MGETTRQSNGPLPICIVSGFLGAGKTTLLNNLINGDHGLRMGVLVNDFGAIDIDSQLVAGADEDTISLRSGCICCTMRDDFLDAIVKLVKRPDPPEYLLVETSGVSDPGSVVITLTDPALTKALRVETVLTVVDAAEFLGLSEAQYNLAEAQLLTADIVVINKCDLVDEANLESVNNKIRALAPKARLLQTQHGRVHVPIILGEGGERGREQPSLYTRNWQIHKASEGATSGFLVRCQGHRPQHRHKGCTQHEPSHAGHRDCQKHRHRHDGCDSLTSAFQSSSYACESPMVLDKLREVLRDLPTNIYRLKGFFHVDAAPEQRLLIQVVGSRVSALEVEPWGDRTPRTEVVAIGESGTIDDRLLVSLFDTCIARNNISFGKGLAGKMFFWRRRGKRQPSGEESRVS
jgi:G3E family GTPase